MPSTRLAFLIEPRPVQHLDQGAAVVHALHDADAVHQAARGPVPFRQHQHTLGRQGVDGLLELGPVLNVLAGGLLFEDLVTAFSPQRGNLPVEVLIDRTDSP
jgi:hypothetical protein